MEEIGLLQQIAQDKLLIFSSPSSDSYCIIKDAVEQSITHNFYCFHFQFISDAISAEVVNLDSMCLARPQG
jgi:hypothetical protein